MNKLPKLIPIWLWVTIIIIIVLLCSSCRGGRSLGSGSAGTIILPQTPQQINRSNRLLETPPDFQPLAPIPIVPPQSQPVPMRPAYGGPDVEILDKSVAPKTTIKEVKAEPKPLSKAPTNLIAGDGGCVIITPQPENLPTDNKATDPIIKLDPRESDGTFNPKEKERFDWGELLLNYLLFILGAIFIWTIYDIIKGQITGPPKKKKASKRTRKKKAPNKKLKEYKKTIPKGTFFKNNEKPKQ